MCCTGQMNRLAALIADAMMLYMELYCHLVDGEAQHLQIAGVQYCSGAAVGGLRWASPVVNIVLTRV